MKKVISMILVIALTAAVAVGGTLAYLTKDAGTVVNTFNVGGIDVELTEEVGVTTNGGGTVTSDEEGADYTGLMPGDRITKKVTIANTGADDAYVRVTVKLNNADKINSAIDEVYGDTDKGGTAQAVYDAVFAGWGINQAPRPGAAKIADARGVIDGTYGLPEHVLKVDFAKTVKGSTVIGATNWFVAGNEVAGQYWVDGPAAYNGYYTKDMNDYEICYTYYMLLPAGESTTLFEGLNIPADFNADQLAMFDGLTIDVDADAIQAANIPVDAQYIGQAYGQAKTAFALLAGKLTAPESVAIDATVSNSEELDEALKAGAKAVRLEAGEYNLPNSAQNKTLTIVGDEDAVITPMNEGENGCDYGGKGSTITFIGVTIDTKNNTGTYPGFAYMKGIYNNCTIVSGGNQFTTYRDSSFVGCEFNVSGNKYNLWSWGAENISFTDCTFNSDGKALMLYGTANTSMALDNCVFNDNGGLDTMKAAIEVGNDYSKSYNLYVSNTVVNGYAVNNEGINTGTTLWGNKNSMGTDKLNVVIDGVDVY